MGWGVELNAKIITKRWPKEFGFLYGPGVQLLVIGHRLLVFFFDETHERPHLAGFWVLWRPYWRVHCWRPCVLAIALVVAVA